MVASATGAPVRCTQCGSPLDSPIGCFDCHSIYPASSPLNHFERLGIPASYSIDLAALERLYLAWSRELHPDFFQLRPPADQQLSLSLSASLNDAYRTLKDPFARAEYLLHLWGGPSASEQRQMPAGFLEEILELRGEVEEARESSDPSRIEELANRVRSERMRAMDTVAGQFATAGALSPSERATVLVEIRRLLNTVKYLDGLLRELDVARA